MRAAERGQGFGYVRRTQAIICAGDYHNMILPARLDQDQRDAGRRFRRAAHIAVVDSASAQAFQQLPPVHILPDATNHRGSVSPRCGNRATCTMKSRLRLPTMTMFAILFSASAIRRDAA